MSLFIKTLGLAAVLLSDSLPVLAQPQSLEGQPTEQDAQGILPPGHPDGTVVGDGVQDLFGVRAGEPSGSAPTVQSAEVPREDREGSSERIEERLNSTNQEGQTSETGR